MAVTFVRAICLVGGPFYTTSHAMMAGEEDNKLVSNRWTRVV
jgi:hypothetical protein